MEGLLGGQAIGALAGVAFEGFDRGSQLLAECAAQKAALTECACQPVALMRLFSVTPPGRFSRSMTLAALVPARAGAAFFVCVAFSACAAFVAGLALAGAAWARRLATAGLVVATVGMFLIGSCGIKVVVFIGLFERQSPRHDSDHSVCRQIKENSDGRGRTRRDDNQWRGLKNRSHITRCRSQGGSRAILRNSNSLIRRASAAETNRRYS